MGTACRLEPCCSFVPAAGTRDQGWDLRRSSAWSIKRCSAVCCVLLLLLRAAAPACCGGVLLSWCGSAPGLRRQLLSPSRCDPTQLTGRWCCFAGSGMLPTLLWPTHPCWHTVWITRARDDPKIGATRAFSPVVALLCAASVALRGRRHAPGHPSRTLGVGDDEGEVFLWVWGQSKKARCTVSRASVGLSRHAQRPTTTSARSQHITVCSRTSISCGLRVMVKNGRL